MTALKLEWALEKEPKNIQKSVRSYGLCKEYPYDDSTPQWFTVKELALFFQKDWHLLEKRTISKIFKAIKKFEPTPYAQGYDSKNFHISFQDKKLYLEGIALDIRKNLAKYESSYKTYKEGVPCKLKIQI